MISDLAAEVLAKHCLKKAHTDDKNAWAWAELESGKDSESLRVLAGLNAVELSEVDLYFGRALHELGYTVPSNDELMRWYCRNMAEMILSDKVSTDLSCSMVYQIYVDLGYPEYLREWDFLSGDMNPVTYEELSPESFDRLVREQAKKLLSSSL